MKLGTLVNSIEGINTLVSMKLDAKKAFELALFVKKVDAEIKTFNELREAKIKELWEESEGTIRVKNENIQEFAKYMSELADKEIECEVPKLSKDEVKWDIDVKTILALDFIFE